MQIIDGIHYYPRESDAREGFLVVPPVGYTTDKKYPVHFIVHGVGERGAGLLENLMNLSMGFDYDGAGPLPRQYALLTGDLRANANKHGHIVVMVNYPVNFDPSDIDYVLNMVEADFSVDKTRINGVGFSWGGREMMRYIVSSATRAQRFAMVILASPVNPGGNLQYVVDARLQVIGISCQEDPTVSPANVKAIISGINAKNPAIKAYYIELPGKAHSGLMEFLNGNPYIPQTMFSYLDATSTVDRKQYPTSTTKPVDPIPTTPTTVTPVTSYSISGNKIALIGKNSKGYTDGYQGVWALKSAPGGVTAKQVFPTGSSYIDANGILPVPGTYVFTFTLKGASPVDVTVQYGTVTTPVEKIPAGYDLTRKVLSFTDGSVAEGVKADFTTTDGKVYSV